MATRKQWGQLSKQARDRAARQAGEQYGLSRRQARERYNRGTYKPFAKDPVDRVPKNSPRRPQGPDFIPDLKERAMNNMQHHLGELLYWNRFNVLDAIENHASTEALIKMAGASEDELLTWAHFQSKQKYKPPKWLERLGWHDEENEWHNIFWYH